MDDMSVQDIRRDYLGCLVMYKGKPYLFNDINENREAVLVDIEFDKFVIASFSVSAITSNIGRIGLVNTYGLATCISRIPKRLYAIGLRYDNTKFTCLNQLSTDRSAIEYDSLKAFRHPGIAKALRNEYPSLEEACERARIERGCCAFDKQFAVSRGKEILFYTKEVVGYIEDKKIELLPQYLFLGSLLGKYHEKTSRAFKKTPDKR